MEHYWDYVIAGDGVVLLEDWKRHTNATPYTAPELIVEWMTGKVYGHPAHEDGTLVTTSPVVSSDGRKVSTQNTDYVLGEEMAYAR